MKNKENVIEITGKIVLIISAYENLIIQENKMTAIEKDKYLYRVQGKFPYIT